MSAGRRRGLRAARLALGGMAVAHVVEAAVLRRRLRSIAALPSPPASAVASRPAVDVLACAPGGVDRQTLAAAVADMEASGVEAIDLVPGDLPVDRALRLLRRVDPERLADDALYTPGGAHEAVALHPNLASRLGAAAAPPLDKSGTTADLGAPVAPVTPAAPGSVTSGVVDRGGMVRATVRAQRYAPRSARLRIAPNLAAVPLPAGDRWRELDELTAFARTLAGLPPVLVAAETAHLLAMSLGLLVAPGPALAALATWSAQPAMVFGPDRASDPATTLRPPDLTTAALLRLPRALAENLRTLAAGVRAARARDAAWVPAAPPPPAGELFEPRRSDCPWCGSADLVGRLDTPDRLQHKPGSFHLDECRGCGHIFQNPRLSIAGLDYYYDEFYEGLGEEPWSHLFAAMAPAYEKRMDTMARFTEPRAWLDVGTGHAHFCLAARQRWPDTVFDGLDIGEPVEEARRRGWIDTAYQGMLPDLADGLPRSYDVVSMHHYLEHTRDPRLELAAAAKVLEPGGYLMIEVPDPASPWSRRLGAHWRCWFQPQHQHFVRCENMVAALEDMAFEVVSVERGPATEGLDAVSSVALAVDGVAPYGPTPWVGPPSPADRLRRTAAMVAAAPVLAAATVVDAVKDARLRRPGTTRPGNAYRVVARRI
jgi:SAM-dependent methyltransferase